MGINASSIPGTLCHKSTTQPSNNISSEEGLPLVDIQLLASPKTDVPQGVDKPYLQRYSYAPGDTFSWQVRPGLKGSGPQLKISLEDHREIDGHTFYTLECSLALSHGLNVNWEAPRRLMQLRKNLHDPLKQRFGHAKYKLLFAGAPFAHRGGVCGTTSRLRDWLTALTTCMNSGVCSPGETALVLQFLDTPPPSSDEPSPAQAGIASCSSASWKQTDSNLRRRAVPSYPASLHEGQGSHETTSKPDQAAVKSLMALGFSKNRALEAYWACDQKEEAAANFLLENPEY